MKTSESISYNYRLAEVIFNPYPFPDNLSNIITSNFKGSIGWHYLNLIKSDPFLQKYISLIGNHSIEYLHKNHSGILKKIFTYLEESIVKYDPYFYFKPSIKTHSFHCRVGDVIDFCQLHSVKEHLDKPIPSNQCRCINPDNEKPLSNIDSTVYISPLSHYSNFQSQHITLLSGGCFREDADDTRSKIYIQKIKNSLIKQGLSVYSRYRKSADEDLIYSLKSDFYTPSNSRFSQLIYYFRKFIKETNRESVYKKKMTPNIAIFFPCTHKEYKSGELLTCLNRLFESNPTESESFDLFFIFNKNTEDNYSKLRELDLPKFVKNIFIHSLDLTAEDDIYIQPWVNSNIPDKIPPLGLSSGPNQSFFRSFDYLISHENQYSHFLLLETDVHFLQEGWFDKCISFCKVNFFSIAGSTYKGLRSDHKNSTYKDHLNGVALYSNTKQLENILHKSEQTVREYVAAGNYFLNFDIGIDIFRQLDDGNLISDANKFIDTDFIINCSDTDKDIELSNRDVLSFFPNALLLHQKKLKDSTPEFSFIEDSEKYNIKTKKTFLFNFCSHTSKDKKIPLFFHTPKNAGTYINGNMLTFLRFYVRQFNEKVNFNKDLLGKPFDLRIVDSQGNSLFNIYGIDDKSIFKNDNKFVFLQGITYSININYINLDLLNSIDVFCINVTAKAFPFFEKIGDWFDSLSVSFLPFICLRDPFERALSLFKYLGSDSSIHEPTHRKIISKTFEDYMASNQLEDSWLIRSLCRSPVNQDITNKDLESTLSLLSYFTVFSIQNVDMSINKIFYTAYGYSRFDISDDWFNDLNFNQSSSKVDINLHTLPQNTQKAFKTRTFKDQLIFDIFINKKPHQYQQIKNNVICYYNKIEGNSFSKQSEALVDRWSKNWSSKGWNPIVLDSDFAKENPMYHKLNIGDLSSNLYHSSNHGSFGSAEYLSQCYTRWLAYSYFVSLNGSTIWSDYDVYNHSFTYDKFLEFNDECSLYCGAGSTGLMNTTVMGELFHLYHLVQNATDISSIDSLSDEYQNYINKNIDTLSDMHFMQIIFIFKKIFKPLCNNFMGGSMFDFDLFHLHGGIKNDPTGQIAKFVPAILEGNHSRTEQWDIFSDFMNSN
jgi:hypothetical protein